MPVPAFALPWKEERGIRLRLPDAVLSHAFAMSPPHPFDPLTPEEIRLASFQPLLCTRMETRY